MIVGIHHLAVAVRDLERSVRFYHEAAGLDRLGNRVSALAGVSQTEAFGIGSDNASSQFLAGPNAYLELIEIGGDVASSDRDPVAINRPGLRHLCVQNHDCALLETRVRASGGSLIADPLDLGTGNQYAYARDPESNIMEIEGLPYAPVAEATWIGHVALVARSLDRQIAFYEGLAGREITNRARVGPGPQFDTMGALEGVELEGAWLATGNILLEMWHFHSPHYAGPDEQSNIAAPGIHHLAFETDDLASDVARIEALGGRIEPHAYENDAVKGAFARDPEGNILELLQIKQPNCGLAINALRDPQVCTRIEAGK